MTPLVDLPVVRSAMLAKIDEVAMQFYDDLDIDRLDPEYFGSGSEGYQYRGLRDVIGAYRAALDAARSKEGK